MVMKDNIYSVGYINSYIQNMFSQDILLRSVYVRGEVSNVTYHPSGHIYFTMKDKSGTLQCVMFAGKRKTGLKFTLKEGQQIVCLGSVTIYEPRGQYQLMVSSIVLDGEGILYERFEQLKKELYEMGMFSDEYKKPIPKYATRIGIVTASTGAAIQDIINISHRRNPYVQLYLYPAIVQGDGAQASIVNGIRALDEMSLDVIIVGRGGGSIEDLWGFNEESVARAIFECNTPIVSAVGHETDTTIADYVADLRAPTPSAAAELTVFSYEEFEGKISELGQNFQRAMTNCITSKKSQLSRAKLIVERLSPAYNIEKKRTNLIYAEEKLHELMLRKLDVRKHTYEILLEQMKGASPLEKLSKGYAYLEGSDKKAIKSVINVQKDDEVLMHLRDGHIKAKVLEVSANE